MSYTNDDTAHMSARKRFGSGLIRGFVGGNVFGRIEVLHEVHVEDRRKDWC